MAVQFNTIPGNIRVPLFYAEFNPAQTPFETISRLLLIGQKTAAGTAAANVPEFCQGNEDSLFGPGSHAALMYKIARLNAPFQEIWVLPLADNGAGVAATANIEVTTLPTFTGTLTIYIGDRRIQVAAFTTDTKTTLINRLIAAINDDIQLPCTAALVDDVDDDTLLLTAKNKGTLGNSITITTDLYGDEGPMASILTITPFAAGATNPVINTALAELGDEEFDFIAMPYADTTNLGHMNTLLNGVSGRWSPAQQIYGHCFSVHDDTAANLITKGAALNDPHLSILGVYKFPTHPAAVCAAYAAVAAVHLQDAPELSRPLQSLWLQGVTASKRISNRFNLPTQQSLLYKGISTYYVHRTGSVHVSRIITTYQSNAWGSPDASWLDVETMFQNMFAIRSFKADITGIWGRSSLRDDDDDIGAGDGIATPSALKKTLVHTYTKLSLLNVVENVDDFARFVVVERDLQDANRVNVFLPLDLVNQLRIFAVNATTYLQYQNSALAAGIVGAA